MTDSTPPDGPRSPDPTPPPYSPPPAYGAAPQYQPAPAPGQGYGQQYGGPNPPMNASDEKLWATLVHVGGLLFGFLPALIGYLVLRDRGPFVRHHVTENLNFQITWIIVGVVITILGIVTLGIGFIFFVAFIAYYVLQIIAAVKANAGEYYRYPLCLRLVK